MAPVLGKYIWGLQNKTCSNFKIHVLLSVLIHVISYWLLHQIIYRGIALDLVLTHCTAL